MKKRIISVCVSLVILALVWRSAEPAAILAAAQQTAPAWFWAAVAFTVPLTVATGLRFGALASGTVKFGMALRLILAASTLNMVLPSKMGDVAKAWILRQRGTMTGGRALALVVLEKLLDLWSLVAVGAIALTLAAPDLPGFAVFMAVLWGAALGLLMPMLAGRRALAPLLLLTRRFAKINARLASLIDDWDELIGWFWSRPLRAAAIMGASLLLWVGHMVQIWLFASAIGAVPLGLTMAFAVLAILAGLLPFTFAGVGTRDAALVVLFAPYLGAGGAALLGLCATLRYIIPALAGLPFVSDFWSGQRADAAS
ncbi:MAG: lysylphosphatidylglycerol synthase transmembrane domain-containing protein [Erythrobacter sp.]